MDNVITCQKHKLYSFRMNILINFFGFRQVVVIY